MIIFSCKECGYKSNKMSNLKRHVNSKHSCVAYNTETNLQCTFCDRKFTTKYNCTRHMVLYCKKRYETQNVDICEKCGKTFKRSWNLCRRYNTML